MALFGRTTGRRHCRRRFAGHIRLTQCGPGRWTLTRAFDPTPSYWGHTRPSPRWSVDSITDTL